MPELITVKTEMTSKVIIELNEDEARALYAIFGYSVDAFLAAFYEKMGKAYVQPHEGGARSLHERMRPILHPAFERIDAARKKLKA